MTKTIKVFALLTFIIKLAITCHLLVALEIMIIEVMEYILEQHKDFTACLSKSTQMVLLYYF